MLERTMYDRLLSYLTANKILIIWFSEGTLYEHAIMQLTDKINNGFD